MAQNKFPLIAAGVLMGAGLGGFVDGILLHQILQLHNMLSARIPPDDLIGAKVNMFWDGVFHAGVWFLTVFGLFLLFQAGKRRDVPWSGRTLFGALIIGWGLFNLIEGTIDHQILNLHHVYERASDKLPFDIAFLISGALFIAFGALLLRLDKNNANARGEF